MTAFEDVLGGLVNPDDAPPELREVARLVAFARQPATPAELSNEAALTSEIAAAVRRGMGPVTVSSGHWRGRVAKVISAKVIGVTAAVLVGGGVAAAATGSLPAPVQQVVSEGLHHIGIKVPQPAVTSASLPSGTVPVGRRAGLCLAYDNTSSHAMPEKSLGELKRLAAAAGEDVASYCQGVAAPGKRSTTSTAITSTSGAPGSSEAPQSSNPGRGQNNGQGGPPSSTPKGSVVPGSTTPGNGKGTKPGHGTKSGNGHGHKPVGSQPGTGHGKAKKPGHGTKSGNGHGHKPGSGSGPTHGKSPVSGSNPGKGHGSGGTTTTTTTVVPPSTATAGNGHGNHGSGTTSSLPKNATRPGSGSGHHSAATTRSGSSERAAASRLLRRSVGKGAQLLVEEF